MELTASLISSRLEPVTGASVAAAPDSAAMQRFAAVMQAAEPAATAPAVASTTNPATTGSFGEKIINGMQSVSDEVRASWTRANDILRPSVELGLREMLDLQRHMALMSVQVELLSKGVNSAVQTIEKTVRMQ